MPVGLVNGHGVYAAFAASAPTLQQARDLANDFISGMTGEPIPAGILLGPVVELQIEPSGDVVVTMHTQHRPLALDFQWNGEHVFDLADAFVSSDGGWWHTLVVVPSALVDVDVLGTSTNSLSYAIDTDQGGVGSSLSVEID
jgi:hypothetical protein